MPTRHVAQAHLASLPTTAAVLTALRKAHTARLAIAAGSQPVQHQVVPLTALSGCAAAQGLERVSCDEVAFSADGQYLAVLFCAFRPHTEEEEENDEKETERRATSAVAGQDMNTSLHAVAVLKATEGFREQICLCVQSSKFYDISSLHWAPNASHLSIALAANEGHAQQQPAVFVLEAETGAVRHALGPENENAFRKACKYGKSLYTQLMWSPCGRMLLVHRGAIMASRRRMADLAEEERQGLLVVFDVSQDILVAQSEFTAELVSMLTLAATWAETPGCPSMPSLMVSHGVTLHAPEAFARSGLALSCLPELCILGTHKFSPNGQWLVADVFTDGPCPWCGCGDCIPPDKHMILQCRYGGRHIQFDQEDSFQSTNGRWCWLPCSSGLAVGTGSKAECQIIRLGDQQSPSAIAGSLPDPPVCFSPSLEMVAESNSSPKVMDLLGKELWAHVSGGQHQRLELLAFLPSGCGLVCILIADYKIQGWKARTDLHILSFA